MTIRNRWRTGLVLVMLLTTSAFLIWTPDRASGEVAAEDEEGWLPIWDHTVAFEGQSGKATDGLDIGEVYPEKQGMETVFTSRDSWVYLSYMEDGAWKNEKLWSAPGQQLTPAIGDLRSDLPGNEILVVGLSSGTENVDPGMGTATVLRLSGSQWVAETIFTFPSLIHGCAVGDVDPTIPGNEAVLTTFAKNGSGITVLAWYDQTDKVWKNSTIYSEAGNIRKAVIADVLPERPGLEVLTVTNKGNCTLSYGNNTNWTATRIYVGDSLARVCVGNLDPDENLEVYLGTGTFKVIGLKRSGSTWTPQTLFTDTDQNRGVWVGDVDPSIPGPELYAFGYSRRLVQITGTFSTGWKVKDIFLDTARSHDVRIGDIMFDNPGPEIALVGYSNNLTVVYPSAWESNVAFEGQSGKATDGLDIGEVYPEKQGMETVFTSRDSWVYLSYMEDGAWKNEKLWSAPGQQLTPAIGDLRPDIPGNEILVVGLSSGTENVDPGMGTATVLRRSGSQWAAETIFTFPSLIHGCAIGDVDPTIPGVEAVLTTFAKNGTGSCVLAWYDQTAKVWKNSTMFSEAGNLRKAVIADVLPERPGLEVLTVTNKGNCTMAYGDHTNWTASRVYVGDSLARVAVGNLDPDENLEIYLGTGTNKVIGLKRSGATWTPQTLFTDTDQNRGVWVGDVDPSIPGPELYAFGYSRRLVQISGTFSTGWKVKDIFLDAGRSHEIRIGNVRASTPGPEIALVGYSNNLTIISPRSSGTPTPPTVTGKTAETLDSGATKTIDFTVSANSLITVTATTDSTAITMEQRPAQVPYYGRVRLTITAKHTNADPTAKIEVKVAAEGVWTWHNITLSIKGDKVVPTIPKVTNSTGATLLPNATISKDEVLHITLSKPITIASFNDALSKGMLKVVWGGIKRDAVFTLSPDGTVISIDLRGLAPIGTVTVTVGGVQDIAGNVLETRTYDFKVKADEREPRGDDLVLFVIIAVVILLIILVLAILIFSKGKKNEEESPKEDEEADDGGNKAGGETAKEEGEGPKESEGKEE